MLFGGILSSLGIKIRIVHDFLDHCWNEAMLTSSPSEDAQWVHVDPTLDYPISPSVKASMCWPLLQIR
jgi:peptide-N4-(N-acetyl-beta-glucosaminyl)asparagine amidase